MKRYQFYCKGALVGLMLFCLTSTSQSFAQVDKAVQMLDSASYAEAQTYLEGMLKSNPADTTARYYLGIAYLQQNKFDAALNELKTVESEQGKASRLPRTQVPSVYQYDIALAQVYLGLHQYKDAWPRLEAARVEAPDSSDVYLYRGIYFYGQKDFDKALKDLEKSVELGTDNAYVYYYTGMVYSKKKMPDEMVEAFRKFLKLAPGAPEASEVNRMIDEAC
jgi:tetratricopeptide (TPR) repeat protein